jgi:hypothetical protein
MHSPDKEACVLHQIVLRLARNPGFPEGDEGQGYVLVAPLDGDLKLDAAAWRQNPSACTVVRFKPGEERDAAGLLHHRGARWFFDYRDECDDDDEPVYRLGDHRLGLGDYVTIHESDGKVLTYRVTQSSPYRAPAAAGAGKKEQA